MRQIAAPAARDMGIFILMLCALPDSILGKQRLKAVKTCFCSSKHAKRCGKATYTGPKGRNRSDPRVDSCFGHYDLMATEGAAAVFSIGNNHLCTRSHGDSCEHPSMLRLPEVNRRMWRDEDSIFTNLPTEAALPHRRLHKAARPEYDFSDGRKSRNIHASRSCSR